MILIQKSVTVFFKIKYKIKIFYQLLIQNFRNRKLYFTNLKKSFEISNTKKIEDIRNQKYFHLFSN